MTDPAPATTYTSPLTPRLPQPGEHLRWGRLYGSSYGLVMAAVARRHPGPLVLITESTPVAQRLEYELRFYLSGEQDLPVLTLPDWETLPYDAFSPHQDIISERLMALHCLPGLQRGILIVPVQTVMQRLSPRSYLDAHSLLIDQGDTLNLEQMRRRLEANGYQYVSTVMEHGEFSVRGSLLDLYPMGSRTPYRIELFDEEIESIRTFDPETQRSIEQIEQVRLLPAREFPLDKAAITGFRQTWRARFEGDPQSCPVYRDITNGLASPGIEYYLPLFFDTTHTLFDYLPDTGLLMMTAAVASAAETFWSEICARHEQHRHDHERPLLAPNEIFLQANEVFAGCKRFPRIDLQRFEHDNARAYTDVCNYATATPPALTLDIRTTHPSDRLKHFVDTYTGRVLFAAETTGRREGLLELLRGCEIQPTPFAHWQAFLAANERIGITVAPLDQGLMLEAPAIAIIAEPQLYGQQVMQRRRRKTSQRDADAIVRNLAELSIGAPVVHENNGVGRYLGLQTLDVGGMSGEFLTLEYAGGDKLYVPVSSLHLISRYTGAAPESAPLHRLGSGQWERAKRKASEKVRDVAAELLDIYAQREARKGYAYDVDEEHYRAFSASFPFEETPDQQAAIDAVIADMRADKPMDRLICGDVGFGKTEVAMRAAFIATQAGKQVAVLVPTTLLAQQHLENFRDRFADWPIRIEALSRFRSKKEQETVLRGLSEGTVDIVIGTHKLLQDDISHKYLGLVVIDEEHRFGVRQKERFKALRAQVDVLTLTATPIPRTLNMALSDLRALSIIATPPARRLAVKTFVSEWNTTLIHEACLREIKRGGQVYFLHNEVESIFEKAAELEALIPEASVRVAHGQMRERELEQAMSDFYHQRFNILVCTTIIETGIDVPSANTIIINRADRFGLAQIYQLRGRVGRSHHRAYAYLLIPSRKAITADALKRLEAIESIEALGTGFTLATHDLEIRGAGELLGEDQSGQMQEIGYTLYTELLERAVHALRAGRDIDLTRPLDHGAEIDLRVPALIPEDYLPDVHERLIIYKRIASATAPEELHELQVEMIDRFGLLPDPIKTLFRVTELKLDAVRLGIRKIDFGPRGGRIIFGDQPNIDPLRIIQLVQTQPQAYRLDGSDKLRISGDFQDRDHRIEALSHLLTSLANKAAA